MVVNVEEAGEWERRFAGVAGPLRDAVRLLIEQHGLSGIVEIEDVAQESGLVMWTQRDRFVQGDGQWRATDDAALLAWATAIARNLVQNVACTARRAARRMPDREPEDVSEIDVASPAPGPEELALRDERCEVLKHGLGQLSELHRQILTLVYRDGIRIGEAARTMVISEDAARKRLRRAIEHLKDFCQRLRS